MVERECLGTGGVVGKPQRRPRRFLAGLAAQKDKMEVEFAFLALAAFAAFMAARSLTAYFKKK